MPSLLRPRPLKPQNCLLAFFASAQVEGGLPESVLSVEAMMLNTYLNRGNGHMTEGNAGLNIRIRPHFATQRFKYIPATRIGLRRIARVNWWDDDIHSSGITYPAIHSSSYLTQT